MQHILLLLAYISWLFMRATSKRASSNSLLASKRSIPETNSSEGIEEHKEASKMTKSNRRKITPKEVYSPQPFTETRCTYHCKYNANSKASTINGTKRIEISLRRR